jgi:hypothetical protein
MVFLTIYIKEEDPVYSTDFSFLCFSTNFSENSFTNNHCYRKMKTEGSTAVNKEAHVLDHTLNILLRLSVLKNKIK